MKRLLLMTIGLMLFLFACDANAKEEVIEDPPEKKEEMTETAALQYLEEITYRYVISSDLEKGSFEYKSELQAAISKCDAIMAEIEEEYVLDEGLPNEIISVAELVKDASQDLLDGKYETEHSKSVAIGEKLGKLSGEYLNNEMPPTIKIKVLQEY